MNIDQIESKIYKRCLPKLPKKCPTFKKSNIARVLSINYDYLPTELDSKKVLWVQLERRPRDLQVGKSALFYFSPNRGTIPGIKQPLFYIMDIVGTRVILTPYQEEEWIPTFHTACNNPFGWGYSTRILNMQPNIKTPFYGYGTSPSFLRYEI